MNVKPAPAARWVPSARQNLFDLERTTLQELVALIAWRAKTVTDTQSEFETVTTTAERELTRARIDSAADLRGFTRIHRCQGLQEWPMDA